MKLDNLYIKNIWESILLLEKYLKNVNLKDFIKNPMLIDAVSKRIEEIGENSQKISSKFKLKNKGVNWESLIKNRNFLAHVYGLTNIQRLYHEIKKELPKLKKEIIKIKKELDKNE
jgi:uncharacterized protein with HEPN domain